MGERKNIIEKLMELEVSPQAEHHYYFTGKSMPLLEDYGFSLIEQIEEKGQMTFKGIVKHFSILMPYFSDMKEAEKFIGKLKESISIAKDCYDEYAGIILIECEKEWGIHGINESVTKVLAYMKSLVHIRFVVLFPHTNQKENELYPVLSTVGVWALVEIGEIDFKTYLEECDRILKEEGLMLSEQMQEEMCDLLNKRQYGVADMEWILTQWGKQVSLNRRLSGNDCRYITMEDISLLSGVNKKKETRMIGFGSGR